MAFLDLLLGPAQHRPMRIRNIFVASLLTMTFGCPGDDSGDTDANTTATTTETPGTTTDTPPGTTTEAPGTTTDMPPGTSSGEPPADSSTGGSGSSTGGMGNAACEQFCADYFSVCGDSAANDYGDVAGCENACALYDQETFDCKEYHASMADGPDSVHCSHANRDGGGVC